MVSSGRNGTKEWVRAAQAAPPQPLLSVFMLHDLAPTAVVGQMAGWLAGWLATSGCPTGRFALC